MAPMPDVPALLETLVKHRVEFLVVGGVAVAHHGYVRATRDMDIVPEPSEGNLSHLWDALVQMEAEPLALGELRPQELPTPFTVEALHALGNWDLATCNGRLDILQYVGGKLETR